MFMLRSVISEKYRYDRTVVSMDAILITREVTKIVAMYNRHVVMDTVVMGEPRPVS